MSDCVHLVVEKLMKPSLIHWAITKDTEEARKQFREQALFGLFTLELGEKLKKHVFLKRLLSSIMENHCKRINYIIHSGSVRFE